MTNHEQQFKEARHRIHAAIDERAEKQTRWLKAAGEVINRSIGQKWRWAKRRSTT